MGVEPLVEDCLDESVADDAHMLANAATAAVEQTTAAPVVECALGELEQFRGLVEGQDRWELLAAICDVEHRGDLLFGQLQSGRHVPTPSLVSWAAAGVPGRYKELENRTIGF